MKNWFKLKAINSFPIKSTNTSLCITISATLTSSNKLQTRKTLCRILQIPSYGVFRTSSYPLRSNNLHKENSIRPFGFYINCGKLKSGPLRLQCKNKAQLPIIMKIQCVPYVVLLRFAVVKLLLNAVGILFLL